jgi:hypothetical protein
VRSGVVLLLDFIRYSMNERDSLSVLKSAPKKQDKT